MARYDWRKDDVERRIIEQTGWDDKHQGSYGLIYFGHALEILKYTDQGPFRWHCKSCDAYGHWEENIPMAELGAEIHPSKAIYGKG